MAGCRHHGSLRKVRSAICALSRTGVDVACVIAKSPPLRSLRYPPRGGALAPRSRAGVNLIPVVYHCGARYRVSAAVTLATSLLYLLRYVIEGFGGVPRMALCPAGPVPGAGSRPGAGAGSRRPLPAA